MWVHGAWWVLPHLSLRTPSNLPDSDKLPTRLPSSSPTSPVSGTVNHSMAKSNFLAVLIVSCLAFHAPPTLCRFPPDTRMGSGPACASARPLVR
eukprot:5878813-Pleurochrysis_carterae.AAC.1